MVRHIIRDTVIAWVSGYVGVRVMDPVATAVYNLASEADKEQEKQASPGVAYEVAARDLAARAGLHITDSEAAAAAQAFHIGLGIQEGQFYVALRRRTGLGMLSAALLSGLALFIGVDEALTPAMGWSAPASAYPRSTHVRGLVAHITLGLATAISAEVLLRLFRGSWKDAQA
jgi:hypothetical protein